MIKRLIADGGSTKIHWAEIADDGCVAKEFFTTGVNPLVMPGQRIAELFAKELPGKIDPATQLIEFYGAGCKGDEACGVIDRALRPVSGGAKVVVASDMLGACRCVMRGEMGVMCILGTGANSCLYDGRDIVANVSPGGYILGDEGSGAWIGRRLASDFMKGLLPDRITEAFQRQFGLDASEIIRRVYRPGAGEDAPNRFLASLAPFVGAHMVEPAMRDIVKTGFTEFFERNVAAYFADGMARRDVGVNFVGSVAKAFEPLLREVAEALGYRVDVVAASPIEVLTGRDAALP